MSGVGIPFFVLEGLQSLVNGVAAGGFLAVAGLCSCHVVRLSWLLVLV